MGTQPTVWNDPNGTPALRTQLLWDIQRQQSPGDIHIMDALRTPAGCQVLVDKGLVLNLMTGCTFQ